MVIPTIIDAILYPPYIRNHREIITGVMSSDMDDCVEGPTP